MLSLSSYLSLIFKHSDEKFDKNIVNPILGGRLLRPPGSATGNRWHTYPVMLASYPSKYLKREMNILLCWMFATYSSKSFKKEDKYRRIHFLKTHDGEQNAKSNTMILVIVSCFVGFSKKISAIHEFCFRFIRLSAFIRKNYNFYRKTFKHIKVECWVWIWSVLLVPTKSYLHVFAFDYGINFTSFDTRIRRRWGGG